MIWSFLKKSIENSFENKKIEITPIYHIDNKRIEIMFDYIGPGPSKSNMDKI